MFEIFRSLRLRRLFLGESLLLVLVAILTVRLRIRWGFEPEDLPGTANWPYWKEVLFAGMTIPIAVQLALYYTGLYEKKSLVAGPALLVRLVLAHLMASIALALLYYIFPQYRAQRLALGMAMAINCWLVFSIRHHLDEFIATGAWRRRLIVVGTGKLARWISRELAKTPGAGYEFVGWLEARPRERMPLHGAALHGRPILGSYDSVQTVVENNKVDDVVFAPDERRGCKELMELLVTVRLRGVSVWSAQHFLEDLLQCLPIDLLHPSSFVFDDGFEKSSISMGLKRLLDVVGSLIALIISLPIIVLTAVFIKIDSCGPVFYRQNRVGLNGRVFTIYKFRSMRVEKPGDLERLTTKNDDRITRVGRFIRLHRIDEIPQFFNVIKGDMSLVGPRPEVLYSVEEQRRLIPFYDMRHAIRPGITSLGQVKFGGASTIEESRERLQYDLYYQKNRSLVFDLSILLDTVKVVLLKIGAR